MVHPELPAEFFQRCIGAIFDSTHQDVPANLPVASGTWFATTLEIIPFTQPIINRALVYLINSGNFRLTSTATDIANNQCPYIFAIGYAKTIVQFYK